MWRVRVCCAHGKVEEVGRKRRTLQVGHIASGASSPTEELSVRWVVTLVEVVAAPTVFCVSAGAWLEEEVVACGVVGWLLWAGALSSLSAKLKGIAAGVDWEAGVVWGSEEAEGGLDVLKEVVRVLVGVGGSMVTVFSALFKRRCISTWGTLTLLCQPHQRRLSG